MKNTFRSTLKKEDFINWEKLQFKRAKFIPFLIIVVMMFIISAYYFIISNSLAFIISAIIAVVICGLFVFYKYNISIRKRVEKYIASDTQYLSPYEVTIDVNTVEFKNLPMKNEAGIISVYPYSIMRAIYETENYFYFIIGFEIKILPKRDIPDEMKQQVFSQIKKNKNCIFVK